MKIFEVMKDEKKLKEHLIKRSKEASKAELKLEKVVIKKK